MAVQKKDLWVVYGSATMPDDDSTTQIGGAVSRSKKVVFKDFAANTQVQAVSSDGGDTTQTVTVHGINSAGEVDSEVITLNGRTFVQAGTPETWKYLNRAIKSASCAGTVALVKTSAEVSGTAQGGGADYIDLAAGASAVDDFYKGMLVRISAGTGQYQLREIVSYNGTTKRAYVKDWSTNPDATSQYSIYIGALFDKTPNEILEVRKVFYNASAEAKDGSDKTYYEKIFVANDHATLSLIQSVIKEGTGGSASKIAFSLESGLDGSDDNGAGNNRLVAPSGHTFNSNDKNVPNSQNFTAGSVLGVWIALTLSAGDAEAVSTYPLIVEGKSA